MARQKFGSSHTKEKLDVISGYLESYTTALSRTGFRLVYFDAFAGTGSVEIGPSDSAVDQKDLLASVDDINPIIEGSARRALQLSRPFDEYVFVESSKRKAADLEQLKGEFPDLADRITIRNSDANEELIQFCRNTNWKGTRSVVFLDPCGSQAGWHTICEISKTEAIDLWYLFPDFLSVFRQISKDGRTTPEAAASIDRILGPGDWRTAFITKEHRKDLFDQPQQYGEKRVTVDQITRFMIEQMQSEFRGGVLESWLPLGPGGQHWFSLLFAWANPSKRASSLAKRIARHLMVRD